MFVALDDSAVLYRQIYEQIRKSVLDGKLRAGSRMPSTRGLAVELGVSRRTVLLAYQELLAEGFIVGKVGGGTYVASELPDVRFNPEKNRDSEGEDRIGPKPRLSEYGRRISKTLGRTVASWPARQAQIPYNFHFGQPAVDWFPRETWRRLLNRWAQRPSLDSLGFSPPEGHPPLREAIADYLARARGVSCTPDQVIIVGGSQQAIDLTARLFIDAGDCVAIEEPHYHAARQIFVTAGATLLPIPVDGDGLDVGKLEARGSKVRLLFTTPSHQFPTGALMPLARRLAMLQWAKRNNAYILEDDYNSEFRFSGKPIASIQGIDRGDRVIYVGTFSKALFPALRLGYIVAPKAVVPLFKSAKFFSTGYTPLLQQKVLTDFINEGDFDRHLRRVRRWAAVRKQVTLDAIQQYLGDRVTVQGSDGGLHMIVWFNNISRYEVPALVSAAAEKGVGIYPIAPYYLKPPEQGGILLGYASMIEKDIRDGIHVLSKLVK